jgi:hypothetical protein
MFLKIFLWILALGILFAFVGAILSSINNNEDNTDIHL